MKPVAEMTDDEFDAEVRRVYLAVYADKIRGRGYKVPKNERTIEWLGKLYMRLEEQQRIQQIVNETKTPESDAVFDGDYQGAGRGSSSCGGGRRVIRSSKPMS